ncbi:hypothetical protein T4C_2022 [Trichinella pseudospiralis]|nr:hypothetical protein T4C_2022 [Trichinella pseudospiralis]
MQHHVKWNKAQWPKAAEKILKNVYVDDLLCSFDDRTEAMECMKELKQLMGTAGFCLTKWSSNEPTVLRSLPEKMLYQSVWRCIRDGIMECVLSDVF